MNLKELKEKRILILGFGREGRNTFKFLRKLFPDKVLGVGDKKEFPISNFQFLKILKKDKNVTLHLGEKYLEAVGNYDVIIKSPGIPPRVLTPYIKKNQIITTATEIFFENCPGKIIGITGTKGKSTTASLIYQILKKGGLRVHLFGNIGKPVLSFLFRAKSDSIYVFELSSHQLVNLKKSPWIAVFLNIYPEHLDYYKNFQEYANSKANITRYQKKNDYLVFNSEDKIVKKFAKISKAKKIPIKGSYYKLNEKAARAVGEILKISKTIIEKTIREFKPLPHRLEYVGNFRGINFYNDSLSTVPESAIAALDTLGKNVQTIILGGFDRKISFENLAKKILQSRIKTLILFPTTGQIILKEMQRISNRKTRLPDYFFVNNMPKALKISYEKTPRGKICLLSCASPSFGIFKDYRERGNLFKKYVKIYGKRK